MNKKVTGIVAYITIIGWIVAFLAGDKEGAKQHLNQGLVLFLANLALSIITRILGGLPFVGGIIALVCSILSLVLFALCIVGIIFAATDNNKELPIIGAFKILK